MPDCSPPNRAVVYQLLCQPAPRGLNASAADGRLSPSAGPAGPNARTLAGRSVVAAGALAGLLAALPLCAGAGCWRAGAG